MTEIRKEISIEFDKHTLLKNEEAIPFHKEGFIIELSLGHDGIEFPSSVELGVFRSDDQDQVSRILSQLVASTGALNRSQFGVLCKRFIQGVQPNDQGIYPYLSNITVKYYNGEGKSWLMVPTKKVESEVSRNEMNYDSDRTYD